MEIDKLRGLLVTYDELGKQLSDPNTVSDMKRFVKINKQYKDLEQVVQVSKKYIFLCENISQAREVIEKEKDADFKQLAKEELEELTPKKEKLAEALKILLIPKLPEDSKNAIIEIRAGTGGDEASIFAGDIFRMYTKYIERKGWKIEVVDKNEGTVGGFKEVIFNVLANGAFGEFKFEAGVHRVQRVPDTETQGRVHTSAASVMVFPEAEEFDVTIKNSDIRKDTYCSSGPGGQSVNTTYSAIRLTHIPTGIVATCQDEKSQIKNHEKALKVLRSRLYEKQLQEKLALDAEKRKTMVSTGDRSEKIRTYNYPQSRVTDHRVGLTLYNLPDIMNGDIEKIIEALKLAENTERLNSGESII